MSLASELASLHGILVGKGEAGRRATKGLTDLRPGNVDLWKERSIPEQHVSMCAMADPHLPRRNISV